MQRIWKRLTYANVMSSLAVFLVVAGGSAFAASQLGKNTVGTKQLKKNAVTQAKIKKEAVVGAKIKKGAITGVKVTNDSLTGTQINESTLATVPSATNATNANVASSLTPAEPVHLIGTSGNPPFENGASNIPPEGGISLPPAGFWKDKEGVVHLTGYAKVGSGTLPAVFTLPTGFRPGSGNIIEFEPIDKLVVIVAGSNVTSSGFDLSGKVIGQEKEAIALEGITFRPGS